MFDASGGKLPNRAENIVPALHLKTEPIIVEYNGAFLICGFFSGEQRRNLQEEVLALKTRCESLQTDLQREQTCR
jgi:hypothetical protein